MSPEGLLGMEPLERSVQTCFLCLSPNPSAEQLSSCWGDSQLQQWRARVLEEVYQSGNKLSPEKLEISLQIGCVCLHV